jgi:3-mercaptopyruvate sulfurtransferase SseA
MRSALAAYMLQRMGYRKVLSLTGGYKGWRESQG